MYTNTILHAQFLRTLPSSLTLTLNHFPRLPRTILSPICRSSSDGQGGDNGDARQSPPQITPPDAVEIRFRRGSKRRQRQQQNLSSEVSDPMAAAQKTPPPPPKSWEEMSLSEKALELYVGEKGALFWLNKFAYASIFIVIGGWILFRFVGPSLNLYQLDSAPLTPDAMFKGS